MKFFTVTWDDDAHDELARLWTKNPRIRQEITNASDEIDRLLAIDPLSLGEASSPRTREFVVPPLKVLYFVSEADRIARVLYVKLWPD